MGSHVLKVARAVVGFLVSHCMAGLQTDKANCPACGHEKETTTHFLLHCIKYDHERWAMSQQVKKSRKKMSLETLLGDPEMAVPIANYVHSTGRFRDKPSIRKLRPYILHKKPITDKLKPNEKKKKKKNTRNTHTHISRPL